jgi:hypothetical protein
MHTGKANVEGIEKRGAKIAPVGSTVRGCPAALALG